jgi:hypothetical protein
VDSLCSTLTQQIFNALRIMTRPVWAFLLLLNAHAFANTWCAGYYVYCILCPPQTRAASAHYLRWYKVLLCVRKCHLTRRTGACGLHSRNGLEVQSAVRLILPPSHSSKYQPSFTGIRRQSHWFPLRRDSLMVKNVRSFTLRSAHFTHFCAYRRFLVSYVHSLQCAVQPSKRHYA